MAATGRKEACPAHEHIEQGLRATVTKDASQDRDGE